MKKTFEADVKHCVWKIIEDYLFYCFLFFMSCSKWRCNSFCSFTRIIYDAHKKVSLVQNSCQKFSKDSFLFFSVLILRIVRLLATLKAYLYCGWNKNTRLSVIQNASSVRFTLWSNITSPFSQGHPSHSKDELQAITKLKLFQTIKFQNM